MHSRLIQLRWLGTGVVRKTCGNGITYLSCFLSYLTHPYDGDSVIFAVPVATSAAYTISLGGVGEEWSAR